MKKLFVALVFTALSLSVNAQVVESYGGGIVSENSVLDKIDLKEIGRSIHVASIEEGNVVVRRFYRGKWEEFDPTPLKGISKVKTLKLFAYRAVPYLFCQYDDKMSVIRAIGDKWEFVGEETFGEGSVVDPQFSVVGENPFILYKDEEFEVIRMISLLDDSWYDVDLVASEGIRSHKLASSARGDLFAAFLSEIGITIKKVNQTTEYDTWSDLTKKIKLENISYIGDFKFVENVAYITYPNELGSPVITSLADGGKKWETLEEMETALVFGKKDYNLNISEYYFFTSLSDGGIPQFLKNNKKGNWGDVTDLSDKKAKAIASDDYRNIIYIGFVNSSSKLMVKKIEKGENDEDN